MELSTQQELALEPLPYNPVSEAPSHRVGYSRTWHIMESMCIVAASCVLGYAIIETIIDQLKNISQIEHSRHRSLPNFLVNLIAGITAYSLNEKSLL